MTGGSGPAEVADEERGKTGQGRAGGRAWRWVGSRRAGGGAPERRGRAASWSVGKSSGPTVRLETVPKTVLTSDTVCKLGGPQNRLRVYNS